MNKAIISADGLECLSRIFVSCKPIMADILIANQRYVIEAAKAGQDVDYHEFVGNLPQPYPNYDVILKFARSIGTSTINKTVVQLFFGGQPHFDKILDELAKLRNRLKNDFAQKILFAHILIPAKIIQITPSIEAVYENFGIEVPIRNLVHLERDSLEIGGTVLIHYASIIDVAPDQATINSLLEAQSESREFREACHYVKEGGGLDYNNFWDLNRFTKEAIVDRCL